MYNTSLLVYLSTHSVNVSFLSYYERLHLLASLFYIDNLSCHKKLSEMQEKSKLTLEQAKSFMSQKFGCFTVREKPVVTLDDFELYTCPCSFLSSSISEFIEMNRLLKKGVLPFSGGYLEQPFKFLEINAIIEEFINKKQADEEKKQKMKQKRKR